MTAAEGQDSPPLASADPTRPRKIENEFACSIGQVNEACCLSGPVNKLAIIRRSYDKSRK
jgi:hypothetical protein